MADATGYKQESGSSSDEVLRSIIFNKLPLLNSPGELIPNTLYYDAHNSSVAAAETTNFFARDRIAFNSKSFGSAPSISIPNVFFTGTCFVVMELDDTAVWPGNVTDSGFYMPHGWGFHAIENIIYYLGSSSVANVQISGIANFIFQLACCETYEKKQAMLDGAGLYLNTAADNFNLSQIAPPAINKKLFRRYTSAKAIYQGDPTPAQVDVDDSALRLAVVPIRLPFSSMCALEKRLSFDTKLLAQPIQVTVTLRSASQIMAYSNLTVNNLTQSFKSLTFQSQQQGLSDQSLSLRSELLANPRFSVGLPFQYVQDLPFIVPESQNGTYIVNITSMLNADLTTIFLGLRWASDSSAAGRFAPLQFIRMKNLQLLLNGQRLHNYDNSSYDYVYLSNVLTKTHAQVKSSALKNSETDWTKTAQRKYTVQQDSPVYELNISRLRACVLESHLQNTPRFTNQTMQIAFEIDDQVPVFPPSASAADKTNFILQVMYLYNGVFLVGQDGGQSKLITA